MKRQKNGKWIIENDEMLDICIAMYEAYERQKSLGLEATAKRSLNTWHKIHDIMDEANAEF